MSGKLKRPKREIPEAYLLRALEEIRRDGMINSGSAKSAAVAWREIKRREWVIVDRSIGRLIFTEYAPRAALNEAKQMG